MDITITINTDNDAFVGQEDHETARILRKLADSIEQSHGPNNCEGMKLMDYNGNSVGVIEIENY